MKIKKEILWRLKSYPYGVEYNESIDEAREVCARMFDRARKSIKIISGTLNKEFYDSEPIIGSLKKAAQTGVNVEIMYGPGVAINGRQIFTLRDKGVKFYQLPQRPSRHLMSIDDKDARIEITHGPALELTNAVIYHNVRSLADMVGHTFKKLRKTAARI